MASIALQHRSEILQAVAAGKRLADLNLGVSRQALHAALAKDPEYRAALESGLEAKLEQREAELEVASEQIDLARADRLLNHARWMAERTAPHRWGVKQLVSHEHALTIGPALADVARKLLSRVQGPVDITHNSGVIDQSTQALPAPVLQQSNIDNLAVPVPLMHHAEEGGVAPLPEPTPPPSEKGSP